MGTFSSPRIYHYSFRLRDRLILELKEENGQISIPLNSKIDGYAIRRTMKFFDFISKKAPSYQKPYDTKKSNRLDIIEVIENEKNSVLKIKEDILNQLQTKMNNFEKILL